MINKISINKYVNELKSDVIYPIKIKGNNLFLLKKNNQVFAGNLNCPHANAKLTLGKITTENEIVCPLHNYKFNLKNGKSTDGNNLCLKMYKTVIEAGMIFIII